MKSNAERVEGVVLVLIVLTVGGLAGAASFTHVHDWTMANSPAGTGDWFGWANAAISELLPLAALLTIRRRRRTGGPVGYPLFLLVCAVALSLAAQLAVAQPSLSGWLLSAVPALAFLGLSKLVFSTTPAVSVPAAGDTSADSSDWGEWSPEDDQTDERPPLRLVDVDQAVTVEPARPMAVQRPGLVPVSAAAFAPRNGASGAERDR
ncbi:DUF2637 domain-containing protein [Micromonospora sp. HM134]|uniref:DUF2637 domain-containing protein n=1 Tax=Micromonospora sp. HM134 TaxID=2583243 RepID=UPI001198C88D|nr:DUF2637 domain-containing protein [Micromonospora sp. HM134]QDY10180.1 DUF2637 domain-containing protein [Micromonospora sp. HM134]